MPRPSTHWNTASGAEFRRFIGSCVATRERMTVGVLAANICNLSWDADRTYCYFYFLKGCPNFRVYRLPRPCGSEWDSFTDDVLLSHINMTWIGWCREGLFEARHGSLWRPLQYRPRTPPRRQTRLPPGRFKDPPSGQDTAPDIGGVQELPGRCPYDGNL